MADGRSDEIGERDAEVTFRFPVHPMADGERRALEAADRVPAIVSCTSRTRWSETSALAAPPVSQGGVTVQDWWSVLPAIEAVVGLFIEISLIATFTRRFLGG